AAQRVHLNNIGTLGDWDNRTGDAEITAAAVYFKLPLVIIRDTLALHVGPPGAPVAYLDHSKSHYSTVATSPAATPELYDKEGSLLGRDVLWPTITEWSVDVTGREEFDQEALVMSPTLEAYRVVLGHERTRYNKLVAEKTPNPAKQTSIEK